MSLRRWLEPRLTHDKPYISECFLNESHRKLPRYAKFNLGQKKHACVPPTNKSCLTLCPKTLTQATKPFTTWPPTFLSSLFLPEHHVSRKGLPSQEGTCFSTPLSLCPFCSLCVEPSPTLFSTFYICNFLNFCLAFQTQLQCLSPPLCCPHSSPSEPEVPWTPTSLHIPLMFIMKCCVFFLTEV